MIKNKTIKNVSTIFTIVKLYTDNININNNIDKISGDHERYYDSFLFSTKNQVSIKKSFNIELGKDPVLPMIWNRERLISCLEDVGTLNNPWKQDVLNHYYNLFLPMGLTVIHNGNHSTNSGIIKCTGSLNYSTEKNNIYDISYLYKYVYYDGIFYRSSKDNRKLFKAPFEYGCIFEIGRVIKENHISYIEFKDREKFLL